MSFCASAAFRIPPDDANAKLRAVLKFLTFDIDVLDDVERLTVMVEPFSDCDVLWVCSDGFSIEAAAKQIHVVRELLPATFPGYEYTEV